MMQIDSVIQYAEQHCKQRGVRLTTKRKQVLSALVQSNKALSAYELIEHCKELFDQSIPAMSVYRILEFLETEHLVHKLSLANKYVACAHICCSHGHGVPQFLICGKCNKVKEITIAASTIDELKQNAQQAGFTLVSQQLEMNCVCDDCLNQAA